MAYTMMRKGDNEELAGLRDAAHARFMRGRRNFAESNPMALNPWERAQLINGDATSRGLQAHELAMLDKQNAGALAVEQKKARGMIGQGSEAAKANAQGLVESERLRGNALRDVEETKGYYGLTAEEARIAGQKAVADTQGQAQRDVATIQGTWGVKQQEAANIGQRAQAEVMAQKLAMQHENAKEVAAIRAGNQTQLAEQKAFTQALDTKNVLPEMAGSKVAQLKAYAVKYANDPEKLKMIEEALRGLGASMPAATTPGGAGATTGGTGTSAYAR